MQNSTTGTVTDAPALFGASARWSGWAEQSTRATNNIGIANRNDVFL
jgi:hypothetical protein